MTTFGMAMGPLAVLDLAGLDVGWRIRKNTATMRSRPKEFLARRPPVRTGPLRPEDRRGGTSTKPEAGRRRPIRSRAALEKRPPVGIADGPSRGDRRATVYALINEGACILEEKIALRAGDIDIVYVYGYGFPAWRGGPMWYADTIGLKRVYDRICQFEQQHGKLWTPANLLKQLAETGKTCAELDREKSQT